MTSSNRVLRKPSLSSRPMQLGEPGQPTSQVLRMIEEASQAAYEQGFAAGREAAEADFEARMPQLESALSASVEEHLSRLREGIRGLTPDILDVAMQMAEVIIGQRPADADTLLSRVTHVLDQVDDDTAVLRVASRDVDLFSRSLPAQVQVVEDPTLAPGEARLEGTWASADLTYAALLEALRRSYDT